jgi:hypothetical protein
MTPVFEHNFDTNRSATGSRGAVMGLLAVALLLAAGAAQAGRSGAFEGTVERVWEDGFRLDAGSRHVTVDAYDLCGDFTQRHVAVGDRLSITGEFEGGELDVFTMVREDGSKVCR